MRHYAYEPFERRRQTSAHSRNPKVDRDQRKKDVEQQYFYGVGSYRSPPPPHRRRSRRARRGGESTIGFAGEIKKQPGDQNQRQAGDQNPPAVFQRTFQ